MSEVYFTSLRTRVGESLLDKLERLVRAVRAWTKLILTINM